MSQDILPVNSVALMKQPISNTAAFQDHMQTSAPRGAGQSSMPDGINKISDLPPEVMKGIMMAFVTDMNRLIRRSEERMKAERQNADRR